MIDCRVDWYSDDKKHVIRNDVILVLPVRPDIRVLLCVLQKKLFTSEQQWMSRS